MKIIENKYAIKGNNPLDPLDPHGFQKLNYEFNFLEIKIFWIFGSIDVDQVDKDSPKGDKTNVSNIDLLLFF